MPTEIEARFSILDEGRAELLRTVGAIDGVTLSPGITARIVDTYLDTKDRRLLASGYVCRRRTTPPDTRILITVKKVTNDSAAIHTREEVEVPLESDAPATVWPEGLARTRVLSIVDGEPLSPLVTLEQARVRRDVLKGNRLIAEWSVDDVRLPANGRDLHFSELEIELKPGGTSADLEALASRVQAEYGLVPDSESKFTRALAWMDQVTTASPAPAQRKKRRASRPSIALDDPMAEAARKTLLVYWGRMLDQEDGVREGTDIERVHDMRVATRRMRTALRIFREYLDRAAFRPFRKALRRTARTLGTVRDLDIFQEHLKSYVETLPEARRVELDALAVAWETVHVRARRDLIAWLDNKAYAQFTAAFDAFLRTPGAGAAPAETFGGTALTYRVREMGPPILLRLWASVRAYDAAVSSREPPLAQLHQLRIAAKRLRYALEFLAGVLDGHAPQLIKQTKTVQDHLGRVQDGVVACNILQDFLTWGEWSPADKKPSRRPRNLVVAPGVTAYLAARQNEIRQLVQTFPEVWAPVRASTFKQQLLALIADW